VTPRADADTVANDEAGVYNLTAAEGLGYSYRWDLNNDGKWDNEKFGSRTQASLNLAAKENRTVRLEVKNAFGRTAVRSFSFERPAADLSGATPLPDRPAPGTGKARQLPSVRQIAPSEVAK